MFSHDWLVVFLDTDTKSKTVIVNSQDDLQAFYDDHKSEIYVGYNSRNYDQWIYKGILCGFNPKEINDFIIVEGRKGWEFSNVLRKVNFINYDIYQNTDRGLKFFEGSLGNDIQETSVAFDTPWKLGEIEIAEVIDYCTHDVEQTIQVFLERKADFNAQMGLIKMFDLPLSDLGKTKPQLSAKILQARRRNYDDEFDINIPSTLKVEKYAQIVNWYRDPENMKYTVDPTDPKSKKNVLKTEVAGVPHVFGWGGVHGALEQYHGEGYFINMDVASLYPSLMIEYDLHSRSCNPDKFKYIYDSRLKYKAEKNPMQAPLKIVLNSTYGAMKDIYNPLYDPRQANRVCVHGQLLLLDLMEHLEPFCEIIQSNTDGVLIKMPADCAATDFIPDDEIRRDVFFSMIDNIAYEWEKRTGLKLEFDEFKTVYQKDVNNYVMVDFEGHYKSKGTYVKKLGNLDYDLAIVNQAIVNYMLHGIAPEVTINACDDLKAFQMVARCSSKYSGFVHGRKRLNERTIRLFASDDDRDAGIIKIHAKTERATKVSNSPAHCFVINDDINGATVPRKLNKDWYINLAYKRLSDFGVRTDGTIQRLHTN